jgi:RNA polymerase-binding transcription factor DksA
MTSTDELKTALSARLIGLRTLDQIGRDHIEVVRSTWEDALTRKRDMATLISDALERIDSETYGLCTVCEERITPKRLAAVPWAKYCMTCQEARDSFTPEFRWDSAA